MNKILEVQKSDFFKKLKEAYKEGKATIWKVPSEDGYKYKVELPLEIGCCYFSFIISKEEYDLLFACEK